MLLRRHCPHTGVVNFYAAAEPFLAVGSVIKADEPALYHWRYYLGQESAGGAAPDMRTAEMQLVNRHRAHLQAPAEAGDVAPAALERNGRIRVAMLASSGKR